MIICIIPNILSTTLFFFFNFYLTECVKMVKNYRVVVFGVKGVGKTAILEQAIYGHYSKNYVSLLEHRGQLIFIIAI